MGATLNAIAEVFDGNQWYHNEQLVFGDAEWLTASPFEFRNYAMFSFLGWHYNLNGIPSLSFQGGIPTDSVFLNTKIKNEEITLRQDILSDSSNYDHACYTLAQLLDFDYNSSFEDLRTTEVFIEEDEYVKTNSGHVVEKGFGKQKTFKDVLGESYFRDLKILKTLGRPEDVRVIIWFD